MYGGITAAVAKHFDHQYPTMRDFYRDVFVRSVLAEPWIYFRKIARQMTDAVGRPLANSRLVVDSTDTIAQEIMGRHRDVAWIFSMPMNGQVRGLLSNDLSVVSRLLNRQGHWILVIVAAAMVAAFLGGSIGRPPAFGALVMTGAWVAQASTVALSHTFDIDRYFWIGAPLRLGAGALALFRFLTRFSGRVGRVDNKWRCWVSRRAVPHRARSTGRTWQIAQEKRPRPKKKSRKVDGGTGPSTS